MRARVIDMTETRKYITVHGIASHGGHGMDNDGCGYASEHYGTLEDESLWKEVRWMETEDEWDGTDWQVRSIVIEFGEIMELDKAALKAVQSALSTRAEDTPLECGGHWGWIWEYDEDDFWDRAPEAPKCPDCEEPMRLDRHVPEAEIDRVVVTTEKLDTRHWLYHHCYSYAVIDSGEAVDDDDKSV